MFTRIIQYRTDKLHSIFFTIADLHGTNIGRNRSPDTVLTPIRRGH